MDQGECICDFPEGCVGNGVLYCEGCGGDLCVCLACEGAGDEDTMRTRLSCIEGNWTGRDREHPVIHGRLFEQGAIALRKQIVDAFPDLLKNERILDLEDQIKSLTSQVNKLNADMERERCEWNRRAEKGVE